MIIIGYALMRIAKALAAIPVAVAPAASTSDHDVVVTA